MTTKKIKWKGSLSDLAELLEIKFLTAIKIHEKNREKVIELLNSSYEIQTAFKDIYINTALDFDDVFTLVFKE